MSKRIYVGNLPYTTSEAELRELFSEHGDVTEVHMVMDRDSGRPRGFGFVEMSSGAEDAIEASRASRSHRRGDRRSRT